MNKEENIDYINSIHDSYIKELQKQDEYIKKLEKENQKLKERLERINNYLDKHYSMENQYWFDHIRDIVEDR